MGTRALTGQVNKPDGTPWASGSVTIELLIAFTTATEVYPATSVTITLEADGTIPSGTELGVPDSGTAYYQFTLPNNKHFRAYVAAGAAIDLVELQTIAGSSIDQDAVQTLLDEAAIFAITSVTTTYQALVTDEYIRANGTFTITLVPAILTQPPIVIKNVGTGIITVARSGTDTISGSTTYTLYPGERHGFIVGASGLWDA